MTRDPAPARACLVTGNSYSRFTEGRPALAQVAVLPSVSSSSQSTSDNDDQLQVTPAELESQGLITDQNLTFFFRKLLRCLPNRQRRCEPMILDQIVHHPRAVYSLSLAMGHSFFSLNFWMSD